VFCRRQDYLFELLDEFGFVLFLSRSHLIFTSDPHLQKNNFIFTQTSFHPCEPRTKEIDFTSKTRTPHLVRNPVLSYQVTLNWRLFLGLVELKLEIYGVL